MSAITRGRIVCAVAALVLAASLALRFGSWPASLSSYGGLLAALGFGLAMFGQKMVRVGIRTRDLDHFFRQEDKAQ